MLGFANGVVVAWTTALVPWHGFPLAMESAACGDMAMPVLSREYEVASVTDELVAVIVAVTGG
jgi:hypothetical protein